ncbi:hypothetical protein Tco_0102975 [Tanacetum coccineum]
MLPKFSQIVNRLYAFIYETNHSKSGLGLPSIVALVMVIDKSWTSLGKHEKAFYTGLKKFVDDCKPLVDSAGNIRCPCKSCRLVLWVSIKHLSDHISKYGFDPSYKTWIHHGEPDLPPPPPVIDNTRQPQMSDMTACLNDLNYIPLNNEQNEPTQGDIGETSNDLTQAKRNEFEELYASANEELYPGCDYVTRLDFMAKFTYFKVKGKLTDSIFNEMLEFFQNVFPTAKGYKLPPSYYAIKKTFKTIGLGYESIHACVNDCFLFRGDVNKDVHFCPVCNTSRWKDSNTPGKKVPKKVLRYFPIIPRLQRLYKSSHTAKEMTWHATGKCTEPGKMQHPVDGKAWKDFDTKYPDFAAEPRNVRLGLAADGFNPFGNLSQSYSMWPVILKQSIVPPLVCMKESSFMWTLFIPGPISVGQAMVLWTINDFPARSSLSGWSGPGYKHALHVMRHSSEIRQRHVDNDPGVSATSELFALACEPTPTSISLNSCVVNGYVRFVVHSRDERRTTQNSGICSPGGNDGEMYYGQLQEILEFSYLSFKVVLFRVKRMLHGAMAVTVAVMIVPLHTIYLPVTGVASLTEEKAPSNTLGSFIREMPLSNLLAEGPGGAEGLAIIFNAACQQHLQKLLLIPTRLLSRQALWVIKPRDWDSMMWRTIRTRERPESINPGRLDAQIAFWNDQEQAPSRSISRQNQQRGGGDGVAAGIRSLASSR